MAYAQLAETNQMVGMYTAVFPVALYTLLGPSRHVSMGEPDSFSGYILIKHLTGFFFLFPGTNPLVSMLVGSVVKKFSMPELPPSTTMSPMTTDSSAPIAQMPFIDDSTPDEPPTYYSDIQVKDEVIEQRAKQTLSSGPNAFEKCV